MNKIKKNNFINIFVVIMAIFISYYLNNLLYGLVIILIYTIYLFYLSSIEKKNKEKLLKEKEYEFANLLGYLLVFLENKFNVYQSLQLASGYCKKIIVKDIEKLLIDIDLDKSIVPYQTFAKNFKSNVIYQVIMMIYQLDVNGYDSKYLNNFPALINSLKQAEIENRINERKTNMSFMTILPIVSLMLAVFSLVLFILENMGGII